jgi:hypothetical protein
VDDSPPDDPFEVPEDSPEPDAGAGAAAEDSSFFGGDALDGADERSFFAQPVPLKWIAGVVNAFVIVPSAPQLGQNRGPWSWMPWTTSTRCPQTLHV